MHIHSKKVTTEGDIPRKTGLLALCISALGVVYGDIGTSPLYTLKETFFGDASAGAESREYPGGPLPHLLDPVPDRGRQVRAAGDAGRPARRGRHLRAPRDHPGAEADRKAGPTRLIWVITTAVMIGAARSTATGSSPRRSPCFRPTRGWRWSRRPSNPPSSPLTVITLLLLFLFQRRGTARVGRAFGPIMLVWFITIGAGGAVLDHRPPRRAPGGESRLWRAFYRGPRHPGRLRARGRRTGHHRRRGALCGHGPLRTQGDPAFMVLVRLPLPAAELLRPGGAAARYAPHPQQSCLLSPFSRSRRSFIYLAVALATMATVIASQALISGAFSLTRQGIALGLFPRLQDRLHLGRDRGPDLHPRGELASHGRLHAPGVRFQDVECPGRGVRHRGDGHDGHHLVHLLFRGARLGMEAVLIGPVCLRFPADRSFLLLSQHPEVRRRRLRSDRDRPLPLFHHEDLAVGPRPARHAFDGLSEGSPPALRGTEAADYGEPDQRIRFGLRNLAQVERAIVFLTSRPVLSPDDPCPIGLRIYIKRNGAVPKHVILLNVAQMSVPEVPAEEYRPGGCARREHRGNQRPLRLHADARRALAPASLKKKSPHQDQREALDHPCRARRRSWSTRRCRLFRRMMVRYFLFIMRFTNSADRYFGLRQFAGRNKMVIPVVIGHKFCPRHRLRRRTRRHNAPRCESLKSGQRDDTPASRCFLLLDMIWTWGSTVCKRTNGFAKSARSRRRSLSVAFRRRNRRRKLRHWEWAPMSKNPTSWKRSV